MNLIRQNISFTIIPAIIISLLFVTPFMVSDEIYNGVNMAKEFWFFGVVALMLLYSAIMLLVKNEKLIIEFNIIDILLLAFYSWCFIRAIFTPYTPFWHNHKLQVLTGMLVVYFFVKTTIKNERINNEGINNEKSTSAFLPFNSSFFILNFFILSGLLQAIYGLLQLYGVYPSHHNLFKITGSFFNPAPYAMYLAVVFPVALGKALFNEYNTRNEITEIIKARNYSFIPSFLHSFIHHVYSFIFSFFHSFIPKYLPFATVVAILLVLPATMNRASWLGAAAGSLVVLQYKYKWWGKIKQWLNTRTKKLLALTGSLVLVSSICISLFYLKAGSSNGRLFIWEVTLGKIVEKPLFGHGLGRFEAEYNNWQAEYFMKHQEEMDGPKGWVAGNTKYGFNEFLEMGSEIGIAGLALFLEVIGITIITGLRNRSQNSGNNCQPPILSNNTHETNASFKFLIISSLISLLVCAAISFPFYNNPVFLMLFIITSHVSSGIQYKFHIKINALAMYIWAPALILSSILIIIWLPNKYKAYQAWQLAIYSYEIGDYREANDLYANNLQKLKNEKPFLQQYGKSLQMVGSNSTAIYVLEEAKKFTSDYILHCTIGNAYLAEKKYNQSENAYRFAAQLEPNKIYPQYLIAKLYNESGQHEKAVAKAYQVLSKIPKTENTAVKEIKTEMKKIITEYEK